MPERFEITHNPDKLGSRVIGAVRRRLGVLAFTLASITRANSTSPVQPEIKPPVVNRASASPKPPHSI